MHKYFSCSHKHIQGYPRRNNGPFTWLVASSYEFFYYIIDNIWILGHWQRPRLKKRNNLENVFLRTYYFLGGLTHFLPIKPSSMQCLTNFSVKYPLFNVNYESYYFFSSKFSPIFLLELLWRYFRAQFISYILSFYGVHGLMDKMTEDMGSVPR